jgi:hypothetical protein
MRPRDWHDYRERRRRRQIAQAEAATDLWAPRPALKSDDAIEAEIAAMAAEKNCVTDQVNAEIAQACARFKRPRCAADGDGRAVDGGTTRIAQRANSSP